MHWNVDLRLDGLVIQDHVAHAVCRVAETDHRAELDVGWRQGAHDVNQALADFRSIALIESAAFLERAGGVVPDERKVVVAVRDELKEEADRSAGAPGGVEDRILGRAWRKQLRVAWIRDIEHGNDGETRIRRHG